MSHIDFLEELNALISEVAILKTTITEDEMKKEVLEVVQKTRFALKQVSEQHAITEHEIA